MSYVLKCYNKSRNTTDKYKLKNDSENTFRLILSDAFSCVIDCFVLDDTKLVNTFDMNYDAVDWLIVKRDYVDIEKSKNDNYQSILKFYIQDNYTKEERYAYLTLTDNLTGDTTFLTIEQPACIYKIEIEDNEQDFTLDFSEKNTANVKVKVYGGHEKLRLYNESLTTVSLKKDYKVIDNKVTIEYPVVDGKVTIDGVEYTVKDNKVTIYGKEYTVIDDKVSIGYTVIDDKVKINGTEYAVKDGKVIENIEVPVEDEIEREIGFKIKEMGLRSQLIESNKTVISKDGVMTRYSTYNITATFNGSLIDEGHKVIGYLRHYDDNDTVSKLIYEAEVPVKTPNINLPESECINRQKENKKNRLTNKPLLIKSNSIKKSVKKTVNTQLPIYIPLEEKYIKGTEIGIVTTNKKGEHDSMIITESYAPLWCHTKTTYDYDNKCHIINIKCDNNFYGKIRKTRILIRNAEVIGSIISYSVSQDTENNVTIERYQ